MGVLKPVKTAGSGPAPYKKAGGNGTLSGCREASSEEACVSSQQLRERTGINYSYLSVKMNGQENDGFELK